MSAVEVSKISDIEPPLVNSNNTKTVPKKTKKYQRKSRPSPVNVKSVHIPSGSEDDDLSDSEDDNKITIKKQQKPSQYRFIVDVPEPGSSIKKSNLRYIWKNSAMNKDLKVLNLQEIQI